MYTSYLEQHVDLPNEVHLDREYYVIKNHFSYLEHLTLLKRKEFEKGIKGRRPSHSRPNRRGTLRVS